jgi:phosphoglycerol transferase MdoB-like AlkP superfamily enzyme
MYKEYEKQILLLFLAICVPYEIILLVLLFTDPNLVGTQVATFNTISKPYIIVFQLFAILTAFITGVVFSIKSMKVDEKEIKWKGRILLTAFISFLIGCLCDALLALSEVPLVIVRLILISSSIEYYLAWFLPDRLKEWLIKTE